MLDSFPDSRFTMLEEITQKQFLIELRVAVETQWTVVQDHLMVLDTMSSQKVGTAKRAIPQKLVVGN